MISTPFHRERGHSERGNRERGIPRSHAPRLAGLLGAVGFIAVLMVPLITLPSALASEPELAARIDGKPVSMAEVDANVRSDLNELQTKMFDLRRRGLEEYITKQLFETEAKKRRISVKALIDAEITAKAIPVTAKDLRDFFDSNQDRIRAPFDQIRDRIQEHLSQRNVAKRQRSFVASLKTGHRIEVLLQPPRIEVSADDDPSTGAANAPITIIEFSDFQCPFCRESHRVLKKVLDLFAGKIRLVYRDYPLDSIHSRARPAALAANCAYEQGKFWSYHDALFENQKRLSDEDLRAYAEQVGLDAQRFGICLSTRKYEDEINQDIKAGRDIGVKSTPTFYINGRLLAGASSFENFKLFIEEELAYGKRAAESSRNVK